MKKLLKGLLLMLSLIFLLISCGNSKEEKVAGDKVMKVGMSFNLPTLDPHQDFNGWMTSVYGVTETLFKIEDDLSISGLLAKEYENNGNTWKIVLKDGLKFSNGNAITSQIVVDNLKRLGASGARFKDFAEHEYNVIDDKVFEITTKAINPTLLNELAAPEMGIIDIEASKDFNTTVVASGPFVVDTFVPNGNITVKRNENYWNGSVKLAGVEFIYFQDPNGKQLALQNGEIDTYYDVRTEANEIFGSDPNYVITRVAGTRIQFMILNEKRLDSDVRKAVNMAINKDKISEFLKGILTKTSAPFSEKAAYGKAKDTPHNVSEAKKILEGKGYTLNKDGYYEKNGKVLEVNIAYYAARSLDVTATLMLEQLKEVGIKAILSVYEDPDATYIATGDFDLALYSMIADKAGDPYYFISSTVKEGSYYDVGGFNDDEAEKMINELKTESNPEKRAKLANEILQKVMDDNAFTYIGIFSRSMVYRKGISNLSENNPFDFYLVNANTNME